MRCLSWKEESLKQNAPAFIEELDQAVDDNSMFLVRSLAKIKSLKSFPGERNPARPVVRSKFQEKSPKEPAKAISNQYPAAERGGARVVFRGFERKEMCYGAHTPPTKRSGPTCDRHTNRP
jgi:hypothetical protein